MKEKKVNKAVLLSKISQEIKTDIMSIMDLTAVAGTSVDDSDKVLECVYQINTTCKRIIKIMEDLGSVSQAAGNQLVLRKEPFGLSSQLQYTINVLRSKGQDKNQRLIVQKLNLQHEKVIGDPQQLNTVLEDVAGYVLRHLPPNSELLMDIEEVPSENVKYAEYNLRFHNVQENLEEVILENTAPPYLLEDVGDKNVGEVLALSSAQRVLELMGGYIRLEPTIAETKELNIRFSLECQENMQLYTEKLEGKKILLVDDEPLVCQCSSKVIEQLGMECDYVSTSAEGLAKLKTNDYFAVIIDFYIAEEDGLELAREIRKFDSHIPLILVSERDWMEIEQEARQAGIDSFILKPIFPSELVGCLLDYVDGMFRLWGKV